MTLGVRTEFSEITRKPNFFVPTLIQVLSLGESDAEQNVLDAIPKDDEIQHIRLDSKSAEDEFCRQLTKRKNHAEVVPELSLLMEFVYDHEIEEWTIWDTRRLLDYCWDAELFGNCVKKSAGKTIRTFLSDENCYNPWLAMAFRTLHVSQKELFVYKQDIELAHGMLQGKHALRRYFDSVERYPPLTKINAQNTQRTKSRDADSFDECAAGTECEVESMEEFWTLPTVSSSEDEKLESTPLVEQILFGRESDTERKKKNRQSSSRAENVATEPHDELDIISVGARSDVIHGSAESDAIYGGPVPMDNEICPALDDAVDGLQDIHFLC